jgi:AcrR family transcriptional regulator
LASQRISEVALQLFSTRGYEGTSLADIAELVGIKKSSIYNHYKDKDDLFLHIFEKSCREELAFRRKTIETRKLTDTKISLEEFIKTARFHILNNYYAKFAFRFTMFPPYHLVDMLKDKIEHFFIDLHSIIFEGLKFYPEYTQLSEDALQQLASHYILLLKGTFADQLNHQYTKESPLTEPAWTHFHAHYKK